MKGAVFLELTFLRSCLADQERPKPVGDFLSDWVSALNSFEYFDTVGLAPLDRGGIQ